MTLMGRRRPGLAFLFEDAQPLGLRREVGDRGVGRSALKGVGKVIQPTIDHLDREGGEGYP